MCGIAGWIDYNKNVGNETETIKKMSDTLKRRGPDASGLYVNEKVALIHRRLIVIDPEGGIQPMTAYGNGEEYTLVYNGELYNTAELKNELLSLGHKFSGHSDTEVLLKSYIEWGSGCLQKLNGIYAFAIWEKNKETLFAARDRIGVKPLFFYEYRGGIIFASEIKTLMANSLVKPEVDSYNLKQLLLLGPGRSCGCGCIKGIKELKPAEYFYYNKNGINIRSYWRLTAQPHTDGLEDTVEKTKELIDDAIKRQLVSDVPLACFLSGGLDSSIISMIAAKQYKEEGKILSTYSVDYENNEKFFIKNIFQPSTDSKYIDIMTKFIGSNHKSVVLDSLEVAESLNEATEARDLPGMADIDSSLLLFCREVKKQNTVCVSGECADEIFGGYPWYHNPEILFKESFPWSNATELRQKLFKSVLCSGDSEEFVRSEYRQTVEGTDYLPSDDKTERRMREMFMLNFSWFMQTLLDRKDRMSMHCGLEVRVPFCDHRLVEYAFNMPWKYKSLYGREKGIVREAYKDLLPEEIVFRKKNPYPKTFNPVFLEYVTNKAENLINDKTSVLYDLVDKDCFKDLKEGRISIENPWYGQLMRIPQIYAYLIQLDAFFKNFNLQIVQ